MQSFNENVPQGSSFRHNIKQEIKIEVNSEESKMHKLIVNADDFGISALRSRGIMELIKQNRVTSVSVLVTGVNGDSVQKYSRQLKQFIFMDQYHQQHTNEEADNQSNSVQQQVENHHSFLLNRVSVGLHFNLTQGPCLSTNSHCDLTNQQTNTFKGKLFIYQYMEKLHQTHSPLPLSVKQLIKSQLRLQIQKFIELFNFRPSHIDGHNHVHCIPQVAEIIGPIMQQYGVYKTRLPEQKLREMNPKSELFVNNAKLSKPIFEKYKIIYPTSFIGCQQINKLDLTKINQKIEKILEKQQSKQSSLKSNRFIELMCHPGYADPGNGDQFNQSQSRQVQMNSLKSKLFQQTFIKPTKIKNNKTVRLPNYNSLQPLPTQTHKKRVLLYSKMNSGCGNWTTSLRLMQIFQSLGYEVYMRSIEENINTHFQIQSLRQFLIHFQISLVIGVNLTRSGRVIYHATRSQNQITNRVPYFFIVAGTDANIYFNKPQAVHVLKQPIQHCELLVSLSDSMVKLTQNFLQNKLNFNPNHKQIILLNQSSNLLAYQQKDPQLISSIYNCLKQNYNLCPKQDKYIVFPASFRPVKDIQFLLKTFNLLIDRQNNNLRVLILGPVLDQGYYEKCFTQMGRVQYLGSLQKQLYIEVLKHAMFLVNTSISQGQSCSIQQAQECGQLCVVRNNQGNCQLVKHMQTGLVFDSPEGFIQLYELIKRNQNNVVNKLKQHALAFHTANFSVYSQKNSYNKIFNQILPQKSMLLTYPDVHSVSQININLYNSIPQELLHEWFFSQNKSKRIIDIGCGSGIFSFTLINKFSTQMQSQIQLELYDYNASVISNCYYNCLQELSGRLKNLKSIQVKVSDMFRNVLHSHYQGNLYVANMPQTPFRNKKSRPDKNGGTDSFRFNGQLISKFSTFHKDSLLIMLYSYMSNPTKFFNLLEDLSLEIVWRSEIHNFFISSRQYDQMQENLSQYIKQHIAEGRAQVQIVEHQGEETFVVPAQMLAIQRKKQLLLCVNSSQIV